MIYLVFYVIYPFLFLHAVALSLALHAPRRRAVARAQAREEAAGAVDKDGQ